MVHRNQKPNQRLSTPLLGVATIGLGDPTVTLGGGTVIELASQSFQSTLFKEG